jgi:hypothetical protein
VARLRSFQESDDSTSISLNLSFGPLPNGTYRLSIPYDSAVSPLEYSKLAVKNGTDKEAPVIIAWQPGDKPLFVQSVKIGLVFSEPIDTSKYSASGIALVENEKKPINLNRLWTDAFHLKLEPEKLLPGATYRLDVRGSALLDLAGNSIVDSLKSYRFVTLSEDSLGTVTGKVIVQVAGKDKSPVVLSFTQIGGKYYLRHKQTGQDFEVSLPAGKYILSGFIDSNRDGVRDLGSVVPYGEAETFATYPDTIGVRARFETAGIQFDFK